MKLVGSQSNPRKRPRVEASHESTVGCTPYFAENKKYDEKEITLMDMVSIIKYCLVYPKILNIHNVFGAVSFDAEKGGVNTGRCKYAFSPSFKLYQPVSTARYS